jgi:hypothetical protein
VKIHPVGALLLDEEGATDRRTDRNDEVIKMHDDLINMSLLGSDPGISHVIHSLIRREEIFATVVGKLLSKSEAVGADTCDDNSTCINNYAERKCNSSCTR